MGIVSLNPGETQKDTELRRKGSKRELEEGRGGNTPTFYLPRHLPVPLIYLACQAQSLFCQEVYLLAAWCLKAEELDRLNKMCKMIFLPNIHKRGIANGESKGENANPVMAPDLNRCPW